MANKFLDIENKYSDYTSSDFVIVPCPHEKTTSYGHGTKNGPQAILDASQYLELFDQELEIDPSKNGINTLAATPISHLALHITKILDDKKIPIILGGEHSISSEAVKATKKKYPDLSVLQFDAHADLRDKYKGQKDSHACAMRRILEVCPVVQVGIRSISEEEWHFANSFCQKNKIHFLNRNTNYPLPITEIINQLSEHIYISFDVDALDPSIMPSTGTPEPGGLLWDEALKILREVISKKTIVGADFVELMPIKGLAAPDFTTAKLIYKTIGYISKK